MLFTKLREMFLPSRSSRQAKVVRREAFRRVLPIETLDSRLALTTYYIDPVIGSDTNPGTSIDRPFRTPVNLSFSTSEGNPNYRDLQAGDVVYLREGVHDWSSLLKIPQTYDENTAFMIRNAYGTASAPITIQAYPGEKPIVKAREPGVANTAIYVIQSSHVKILGLEVTGTFGPGIRVAEADEIEIAHNYVHDVDGHHDNNIAGIYTSDTRGLKIHHNLLHDNYDRARALIPGDDVQRANSRNIVIFGDNSERVVVHHNKVFNTPRADGQDTGAGIWVKHASEIPGATFEFYDNIVRDVQFSAIGSQSPNAYMHHNLIVNGAPFSTSGGDSNVTIVGGHRLEFNTFAGSSAFEIVNGTGFYPTSEFLSFQNNIVVDDEPLYNINNGVLRIDTYGDDSGYRIATSPANLRFDRNVYYNGKADPRWNIFGSTVADSGNSAALGGIWNFAQWQAIGVDANSRVINPQLNASYQPGNSLAANAGWLAGSQPRLTLIVPQDTFRESQGANAASLTIVRSGQSLSLPLTVNLRTTDTSELQLPATVTIPAGVSSVQVPITAIDDNRVEPTRAVQIFATATYAGQPLNGSEWVRVLQDPLSSPPALTVSDVSVVEGDPLVGLPAKAIFTVTATSAATSFPTITVNYATVGGTATAGVDFTNTTGLLMLTSTARSKTITVPIRPDTIREAAETFTLRLSNAIGATLQDGEGVATIIDDDTPQLSINNVSVSEGNSGTKAMTFSISLTKPATQAVSFRASTRAGSATEGIDFQAKSQFFSLAAGQRSASFTVNVIGDTRLESNEDFTVAITELSGAVAANSVGIGTIVNDEAKLPATAEKLGVVRNARDWYLDLAGDGYLAEQKIGFGLAGDRYFTGDMNNDGKEEFVVARENRTRGGIDWYFDLNGDGNLGERIVQFGLLGDIPLVGDFNGDGRDDLASGRWNPARGTYDWYLDTAGDGYLAEKVIPFGLAGDMFLAGDFNGDRRDELIAVRKNFATGGLDWYFDLLGNGGAAERTLSYGLIGDTPVIGDWNGDRYGDEMGVVRKNVQRGGIDWYFDLLGNGGNEELIIEYGLLEDLAVSGRWR